MKIVVIGGGAAGFFAAIAAARAQAGHQVLLLEKSGQVLSKVKVSGGGRCNVTNVCSQPVALAKHYPRGEKFLKKAFSRFTSTDTVEWFLQAGVSLKAEADGRMFPYSDSSQTIIDTLQEQARRWGVSLLLHQEVVSLQPTAQGRFALQLKQEKDLLLADRVIVTTGGSPKAEGLAWLGALGHRIEPPVPSLFTFRIPNDPITALMGVAVPQATVRVATTKLQAEGPLLITHWGLSGPAVLRLSAWGARILHDKGYQAEVLVSWVSDYKEEALRTHLWQLKDELKARQMGNRNPFQLPSRLWEYLLAKAQLPVDKRWGDLAKKDANRLAQLLLADSYQVKGKTTFKEEFVTCGGVSLQDVDVATMQSKVLPGLFFAGEVLDIDGITGGFNFQAAWTTGYIAGTSAAV